MDTEIVLLGMCQSHALKAVRLLFQMNAEHTEHTAGALRAGGGQPAVFLHDLAVDRAEHPEVQREVAHKAV